MIDLPLATSAEDALSQPTRAGWFALVGELKRPVATAKPAERLDLHPNGVRVHLDRLGSAGLVARTRARQPGGRTRDAWRIAPAAGPGGHPPRAYSDLGRWLARATRSGRRGLTAVEATGRECGRELAPRERDAGEEAFQTTLVALGFQPPVQGRTDGRS